MEHKTKIILLSLLLGFTACGVKGRPLPPLNPAPLGRGEPTFKEATQKKNPSKERASDLEDESSGGEEL
ncbi:MAG: hypothetical protein AAGB31_03040 [Bdellovibrio sp.]